MGRAASRLEISPWHCLGLGAAAALLVGIPASLLIGLPGSLSKLLGGSLVTITLALAGIGAAGLVAAMSARLASQVGERLTPLAAFARSAIALELAAILPIIVFDEVQDDVVRLADYEQFARVMGIPGTPASWFPRLDLDSDGCLTRAEVRALTAEFYFSDDPAAPGNWFFGAM